MKRLLLFLCLLSGLPVAAASVSESPTEVSANVNPRFSPNDLAPFVEWVLQRLTFSGGSFIKGNKGYVAVRFGVTKEGGMKNIELVEASAQVYADKILAALNDMPGWTPLMRDGHAVEGALEVGFDFVLARRTDGVLFATNSKTYRRVDVMPSFRGNTTIAFRRWMKEQVDSLLGENLARKYAKAEYVVEKDGALSNLSVVCEESPETAAVVYRILSQSAGWMPGILQGKAVRVEVMQHFPFNAVREVSPGVEEPVPLDKLLASACDVTPEFNGGGLEEFRTWVMQHVSYPTGALMSEIEGRVVASFVVDRDGTVVDVVIVESPGRSFQKAVLRVLENVPKWEPGLLDGKPVRVKFTLPVDFRLWR